MTVDRAELFHDTRTGLGRRQVLVRLLSFVLLRPVEVRFAAQIDGPHCLLAGRISLRGWLAERQSEKGPVVDRRSESGDEVFGAAGGGACSDRLDSKSWSIVMRNRSLWR